MKWSSPQCVSAMFMLLSGVILCYLGFFLSAENDVPQGALWYMGQMLVYAGGIFGLKLYADGKMISFKEDIIKKIKHEDE